MKLSDVTYKPIDNGDYSASSVWANSTQYPTDMKFSSPQFFYDTTTNPFYGLSRHYMIQWPKTEMDPLLLTNAMFVNMASGLGW